MSLAHLLTGLLDQHGDTVQQAALLAYLKQAEEAEPYLEVTSFKSDNEQTNSNHGDGGPCSRVCAR